MTPVNHSWSSCTAIVSISNRLWSWNTSYVSDMPG